MVPNVLIVEDESEFMRRFADAVIADPQLRLVGAVGTGMAGKAMLDAQPTDVMLVDLGLPDISGVEVIRHAARHHPACDVLVVTMFADDSHVMQSIEAGASGYLLKDATGEGIGAAIREIRSGGSPISPGIARQVLRHFRANAVPQPSVLSQRETELLRLVAKGLSFDDVGSVLGISPHTVVAHVKKIYRKLSVHSRGEAVYEASQMGLL